MTVVAFHFNVPDVHEYACRLLRKALRTGARLCVTAERDVLGDLDRRLWVFEPTEFVPHWLGARPTDLPARLSPTPVLLVEQPQTASGYGVLVNLGNTVPPGLAGFDRLIEVVGQDEASRAAARDRWRHYGAAGLSIERHEVKS